MLRNCAFHLAKRTPGYVFWRQNTLTELRDVKRNYLAAERAVPIAEIVRRMQKVQDRYQGTPDYHERNLLRGEYKYYSGKVLDLRASQNSDLIGFLRCCGFFQFWDTAQVEKVMNELLRNSFDLTPNELVYCFASLPPLRKQKSLLFQRLAELLVEVVQELTLEECLLVCVNCNETVPVLLLRELVSFMAPHIGQLPPSQLVLEVLDPLSAAPEELQNHFSDLYDRLLDAVLQHVEELDCMELAIVYYTLRSKNSPKLTPAVEKQLTGRFVELREYGCPRSTAMMFSAISSSSRSIVFPFAEEMEQRVLFLSTDFTTEELLAVFKVYLEVYTSVLGLSLSYRDSSHDTTGIISRSEVKFVAQRESVLREVLHQLTEQLALILDSASTYVSRSQQLEILQLYEEAVQEIITSVELELKDATTAAVEESRSSLVKKIPATRQVLRLLGNKIISDIPHYTFGELIRLLQVADTLGSFYLSDAVVVATLKELLVRPLNESVSEEGTRSAVIQRLSGLSNLREDHQRTLHGGVIPKIVSSYSQ